MTSALRGTLLGSSRVEASPAWGAQGHGPLARVQVGTHLLGQEGTPDGVLVRVGPELDLRQHLVGEGVAHHKARVAHRQPRLTRRPSASRMMRARFFNK